MDALNTGNTAWMLTSASLVLLMTPGLAFFYGGMVRSKSVLNIMMMSFGAMGVVGIIYVLWGYSMSFGSDIAGIFGNPADFFGLKGMDDNANALFSFEDSGVPAYVWVAFQATFAIITVALISGSIPERVKFGSWMVFVAAWVTFVYFPMAHMVWGGGLLTKGPSTPLDFAGGTVVHINAGVAGLILALIIGKRKGFGKEPMRPHNLPFVMLGAALLWFGWFGFNAGSAGAANDQAGLAWITTTVATAAAMVGWLATEKIRDGHATSLGAASGIVAGLVAITPAAGFVSPVGSIFIGLIAGVVCALAVGLKYKLGYDDSLDVVGVHLVGGLWGTLSVGFFATADDLWEGSKAGLFYGGGLTQLATQAIIAIAAIAFSAVVTAIIGYIIKATMGWRVSEEVEVGGIDLAVHGESAYENISSGRIVSEVK
ncbi:ammonium transporter [Rarobacter incanus]|uniref:Ammonium transporter n=1 Tax=Rarobacter incanus TaxID=153494 RepID=A0A542SLA3_9MICO|nr:ammonium transporter [Rarobacter incanus]TQK75409.1 ammonium transporter [Rarobacter incanus]